MTYAFISGGTGTTTLTIGDGTTTVPLAGTFSFGNNGGAVLSPIIPPIRTTAGSALVFKQEGTSNLSITAGGFIE